MTSHKVLIAPSLICADLCNLESQVREMESVGADLLHVDLIDGHFSPSMPIGIQVVRQLRQKTSLPFDVHLMVTDNEFFIREMAGIGVQRLSFHAESAFHLDHALSLVREHGILAGVALMPATPLSVLEYVAERLDFIFLMLINPGFAGHTGEAQVPYALRKVAGCRRFLDDRDLSIPIEVDGRVSFSTIPDLVAAGADILVAGSGTLFHGGATRAQNAARMREAVKLGLQKRTVAHGGSGS